MVASAFSAYDYQYMAEALRLAEQGIYTTTPNPRVGCVIVKDGLIVGRGAHLKAGEPHAEVHALRQAGAFARGADAYVTLEPCSHFGRTPPCADALVQAGIKRVVAAMQDPNPQVAGNGLRRLQAAGIEVTSGLLEAQAQILNQGFISRMTRQRPYVRSKMGASLDGRTALSNGVSKWITSEPARLDVQRWRAQSCAILTGIGTVLADDPQMTVRDSLLLDKTAGRQPLRVVVDSHLRMPLDAKILGANTLIAYTGDPQQKTSALERTGADLMKLPESAGYVCLSGLLRALAERGINDLMVEAGQGLNGALMREKLLDELLIYYAPVILGGDAHGMFASLGLTEMRQRTELKIIDMRQIGSDILIRLTPQC